jgi:hypothetical protein
MTADEMRRHIRNKHGNPWGLSKWRKDHMTEWHEADHEARDFEATATQPQIDARVLTPEGKHYVTGYMRHQHVTLEPSEAEAGMLADVKAGNPLGKVLSASERKSLEQLVNNDFAGLKAQIKQFASDVLAERQEAVRAEWADRTKQIETWATKWARYAERINSDIAKMRGDALAQGVEIAQLPTLSVNVTPKVIGLQEALTEVARECQSDLERALLTLERQRLTAQRTVLMAGISTEGLTLLNTIPSAKDLMASAALERTERKELAG